jgi:integrase
LLDVRVKTHNLCLSESTASGHGNRITNPGRALGVDLTCDNRVTFLNIPESGHVQVRKSRVSNGCSVTVLRLPGFMDEPPRRPALARRVCTASRFKTPGAVDTLVTELRAAARAAAETSRAKSTERAYSNDWRDFCVFARLIGRVPLPAEPETVALYVTDLACRGRVPATIARRLVSIAVYHRAAGYASPTEHGVVRAVVSGLRRQLGVSQQQKTALEIDPLRVVLARIPSDARGLRDRALFLIGWAAALRRSELAALGTSDLRFEPDGLIIALRRSKTDQEAAGEAVAVPFGAQAETCPLRALRAWLVVACGDDGAVFRRIDRHGNIGSNLTATAIASIIRARTAVAGIPGDFAGHSLRAGFATTAAHAGRSEASIMRHGRWKSVQIARRYVRAGSHWHDNPVWHLGL